MSGGKKGILKSCLQKGLLHKACGRKLGGWCKVLGRAGAWAFRSYMGRAPRAPGFRRV
jgi:hypothetical protein